MATATTTSLPFFLISLLILFISCSHIISCFAIATTTHEGQEQVPSSVTPKAAVVHYWHLKTHNNKPLPPILLSKLSLLSPSNDETIKPMSDGDMVKMGKIDEQNFPLYTYYAPNGRHATTGDDAKRGTKHRNFDSNNIKMVTGDEVKVKAEEQNRPDPRGIFFRESELKEGKTNPSIKFAGMGSNQYFLPRSIASKIPFSASAISKIFHIPTDSAMYRIMKNAISHCRMPHNIGETKQCVTSAEDIIDYVVSTLGADTDIQVWTTHNSSGFEGKSLIGKVKVVNDDDGKITAKDPISCHQVAFPYLVHHCHTIPKTRIYDLEILDAETKEKINQAAAVCHFDTSAWSPDHMSFAELGSAPGKTEVCHWIAPWGMAWTTGDVAE